MVQMQAMPVQQVAYVQAPVQQQNSALVEAQRDYDGLKALKNQDFPTQIRCPMCGHVGDTVVTSINGPTAWTSCLGIYVSGLGTWGCCLIPFCVDQAKDKIHKCAKCNHPLARKACF